MRWFSESSRNRRLWRLPSSWEGGSERERERERERSIDVCTLNYMFLLCSKCTCSLYAGKYFLLSISFFILAICTRKFGKPSCRRVMALEYYSFRAQWGIQCLCMQSVYIYSRWHHYMCVCMNNMAWSQNKYEIITSGTTLMVFVSNHSSARLSRDPITAGCEGDRKVREREREREREINDVQHM